MSNDLLVVRDEEHRREAQIRAGGVVPSKCPLSQARLKDLFFP